jgi:hypothetical protein
VHIHGWHIRKHPPPQRNAAHIHTTQFITTHLAKTALTTSYELRQLYLLVCCSGVVPLVSGTQACINRRHMTVNAAKMKYR